MSAHGCLLTVRILYTCMHSFYIMQLDSSYRVYNKSIIQLDSLDGLNSSHLEVVPSYHDQTLALNLTLPRGRIWNVTVIAYCEFAAFELSKYYIIIIIHIHNALSDLIHKACIVLCRCTYSYMSTKFLPLFIPFASMEFCSNHHFN